MRRWSRGILLIVAVLDLVAAQAPPTASCCNCDTPQKEEGVACLSAKEMRLQVNHIEPLRPSGLDKDLNIAGTVVIAVRFQPDGRVDCAHAESGNPIAISAALEAIRKWSFKPLLLNGVAQAGCGRVTIKYRLRDHGSSTELQ